MTIYQYVFAAGFIVFLFSSIFKIFKVVSAGTSDDPSKPIGKIGPAIIYSFTGAMSPNKKESAYLHFPTYIAGIIFHIGTFIVFLWAVVNFFNINIFPFLIYAFFIFLLISFACGLSIFIKRLFNQKLRSISNLDDFISNLIVTGIHAFAVITLMQNSFVPYLFIYSGLLFVYIPMSKLRHSIYFFPARAQLGIFYGRRGVWPNKYKHI
ncbi:hypothetical protein ACFLSV_00195 [Bacteroidota bacterium]